MLRPALLAAVLALPALGAAQSVPQDIADAVTWHNFEDGLARARETGLPVLVWMTPRNCPECGAEGFADADVQGMLPDFVPVRVPAVMADQLGVSAPQRAHALVLDPGGDPVPELFVAAGADGTLPAEGLIDLMSSGLDVLR